MIYQCQLCSSTKQSVLFNKDRNGKRVENFICDQCGFVFILPRPVMEKKVEIYKEGLFSVEARGSNKPNEEKFKRTENLALERMTLLEQTLGNEINLVGNKSKKALEVGCGTGSFLNKMYEKGWEVFGIEPDPVYALAGANRYNIPIESIFLEEFQSSEKFDFISTFHVIEHVDDVNEFLKKLNNLLNEEGILFIECPTIDRMYGPTVQHFFWDVHINTFSDIILKSFLIKHGFEIIKETRFLYFINIICKKKSKKEDYSMFFDRPERIRELIQRRKLKLKAGKNILTRVSKNVRRIKTKVKRLLKILSVNITPK